MADKPLVFTMGRCHRCGRDRPVVGTPPACKGCIKHYQKNMTRRATRQRLEDGLLQGSNDGTAAPVDIQALFNEAIREGLERAKGATE